MRMENFPRAEELECLEVMPRTPRFLQMSIGSTCSTSDQKCRHARNSLTIKTVMQLPITIQSIAMGLKWQRSYDNSGVAQLAEKYFHHDTA